MRPPVALVVGPDEHGVTRHGRSLAASAGSPVVTHPDDVPAASDVVLEVTDRLFGETSDVSGPRLTALVTTLQARGCRVFASLHDVPFAGDGPVQARRAALYRDLVQRSDGVLVCSHTESERLRVLAPDVRVTVVPLPVPTAVGVPSRPTGPATSVTVLGFLYPGKGHAEVLGAMAGLPADLPLVCVGRPADGHADLARSLAGGDRPVQVTGFVPDAELASWLQGATVPVAPNRVVSASGSIATWWSHGRRPLAPDVAYVHELERTNPHGTLRYDDDLADRLAAAVLDPTPTWLPAGAVLHPTTAEVVTARAAAIAGWS